MHLCLSASRHVHACTCSAVQLWHRRKESDSTVSIFHGVQVELRQETSHRPMDLRAAIPQARSMHKEAPQGRPSPLDQEWVVSLRIASNIAAEARAAVKVHALQIRTQTSLTEEIVVLAI